MPFTLDKSDFFIPRQGVNHLRILPSWDPDEHPEFYLEVPTHYEVTTNCRALICRKILNLPCPVEALMARLMRSLSALDHARALRMQPVTRVMMNVHPLGTSQTKVWSISESLLQTLLSTMVYEGYGNLTHYALGHDLRVTRVGEGTQTRYTVHVAPKPSKVSLYRWPDLLYDLTACFQPPLPGEYTEILRAKP